MHIRSDNDRYNIVLVNKWIKYTSWKRWVIADCYIITSVMKTFFSLFFNSDYKFNIMETNVIVEKGNEFLNELTSVVKEISLYIIHNLIYVKFNQNWSNSVSE